MGCEYSKKQKEMLDRQCEHRSHRKKTYLTSVSLDGTTTQRRPTQTEKPEFTEHQKQLVIDSWTIIKEDIAKVGVVMFLRLFETHPYVQDVFMPFRGMTQEDLRQSSQLQAHALRVLGTVDKCLSRISDETKVVELLHELGARHVMYNAKVDYIDLIGPQFLWAIQPTMGEKWTSEIEQSWSDLFKLISHIMKNAMTF